MPSCFDCNNGASKDDEYFRTALSFRHDVTHPDAVFAREVALRSLKRREALGLRAEFLRTARDVEVRTPAGIYLGRRLAYEVENNRVDRVVRRIILGLLYGERGSALPPGYGTRAVLLSQLDQDDLLTSIVSSVLQHGPLRFIGQRTVAYRIAPAEDDRNGSACLVTFYQRITWLGLTSAERDAVPSGS